MTRPAPGGGPAGERAVVVGGAGAVGRLFTERLLAGGAEVHVVDPAPAGTAGARHVAGDITDAGVRSAAGVARADTVVLALPDAAALAAVRSLAGELRPDALLVDTLSVKQPVTAALRESVPGVQALGLNPMFAPSLGFAGRPVAAVEVTAGPRVTEFLTRVEGWGARVVRMDAAGHDRLAGATQALTHAAVLSYGLALVSSGAAAADLRPVAPPPAATMLALLARIASGTPEVYWDVQYTNPRASAARSALAEGLRRIADTVEGGDEAGFAAVLATLREYLGEDLDHHRDTCARLFTSV